MDLHRLWKICTDGGRFRVQHLVRRVTAPLDLCPFLIFSLSSRKFRLICFRTATHISGLKQPQGGIETFALSSILVAVASRSLFSFLLFFPDEFRKRQDIKLPDVYYGRQIRRGRYGMCAKQSKEQREKRTKRDGY